MSNNIPLPNRDHIKSLQQAFKSSPLCPNISCLIVHGSSLYKPFSNQFSDIDLELILKKPAPNDYQTIAKIVTSFSVPVECQLRYQDEIVNQNGLIFKTRYKIFMYYAYKNGITLIGHNLYSKLIDYINPSILKKSLLISTQIYFKDIRKSFFSNASPYIINKNILRTFFDICLYLGLIDPKQLGTESVFKLENSSCISLIIDFFRPYLSKTEITILTKFQQKYISIELFTDIFPVTEKIVHLFIHKFASQDMVSNPASSTSRL